MFDSPMQDGVEARFTTKSAIRPSNVPKMEQKCGLRSPFLGNNGVPPPPPLSASRWQGHEERMFCATTGFDLLMPKQLVSPEELRTPSR